MKPPVIELLVQRGFDLNILDENGRNALHIALAPPVTPPPGSIEFLVQHGVPLNERDHSRKTPLAYWREPRDYESRWFTTWLFERVSHEAFLDQQRHHRAEITALLNRAGAVL